MKKEVVTNYGVADNRENFSSCRARAKIYLSQVENVGMYKKNTELLNLIPCSILILNSFNQIIFSNHYFMENLEIEDESKVLGYCLGEVLGCNHADDMMGCGKAEKCCVCGAANAIRESHSTGNTVNGECLMTCQNEGRRVSREFSISAIPANMINKDYTIIILQDISNEKRRENMERLFFHDLINTAGAVRGLVRNTSEASDLKEMKEMVSCLKDTTDYMNDVIVSQKVLIAAEKGEISLNITEFSLVELTKNIIRYYKDIKSGIVFTYDKDVMIKSDKALVLRVIMNMIKNAVESYKKKEVTIKILEKESHVEVVVHNHAYMPREVQLQVFKRYFSTKGSGRGLGTYSMKLIGEEYLKGYIRFQSDLEEGTTFTFGILYKL